MILRCPKCHSEDVEIVEYMGARCIRCRKCGFDETALYEVYPDSKSNQKEKGRFTPYKAGGAGRVRKA